MQLLEVNKPQRNIVLVNLASCFVNIVALLFVCVPMIWGIYIFIYLCICCWSWHSEYMCHSCPTESVWVY